MLLLSTLSKLMERMLGVVFMISYPKTADDLPNPKLWKSDILIASFAGPSAVGEDPLAEPLSLMLISEMLQCWIDELRSCLN